MRTLFSRQFAERVAPDPSPGPSVSQSVGGARRPSLLAKPTRLYNWLLWALLTTILFAQIFGVIWSSVTTDTHFQLGQSPLLGKLFVSGTNDEPFTDRAVACVKRGQYYRPIQVSQLLKQIDGNSTTKTALHATNGIDGYRLVSRNSFVMDATEFPHYQRQCNVITDTIEGILNTCEVLGYNVTRDTLRVVDGLDSDQVTVFASALPVLIVPIWDYGALSRYIVPGHDGSACVFRASGTFEVPTDTSAFMIAVNQTVREARTQEWLGYPGGVWRNGWYEDPVVHMRWYSDVIGTLPHGPYGMQAREFNLTDDANELDCSRPPYGCGGGGATWMWQDQLHMDVKLRWMESIMVSNGSRYSLFLFDALHSQTIKSRYSLEKLISNASFAVLLSQWFVAMIALSPHHTIGIGAIANTRSFYLLPIFLLPRLKSALEAFWSSGCEFEGDERALADAWFEIYPAIGEIVLVYFSLLNTLTKLLRRRATDAMFGPTLLFFAFLHYFRSEIAGANFLEFDKRISTLITADEVAASTLLDVFTTDLAFRMNGKIKSLYGVKVAMLWLNIVVFVFSSRRASDDWTKVAELQVETALSKRFLGNAGLGSTRSPYETSVARESVMLLHPYELVRGGYIVVRSRGSSKSTTTSGTPTTLRAMLMSISDWFWVVVTIPLRRIRLLPRILVYDVATEPKGEAMLTAKPQMVTVLDDRFDGFVAWTLFAPAMR